MLKQISVPNFNFGYFKSSNSKSITKKSKYSQAVHLFFGNQSKFIKVNREKKDEVVEIINTLKNKLINLYHSYKNINFYKLLFDTMGAKDKKQEVSDHSSEEEFDEEDDEVIYSIIQVGHWRRSHQQDQSSPHP